MSITPSGYVKARAELVALFGWNADSLSPDQTLRIDCAVALRLALDDLQGRIVRGESADVSRMLTASEALARLLPPAVLAAPPPDESHGDPRLVMWEIYKTMRERGEIGLKALPEGGADARIAELEAENRQLKARLVGGPLDVPTSDITPPGELGECYVGSRPGPDDPKPPVTIDGKVVKRPKPPAAAAPAPRPAAPAYDYNKERGWRDHVLPDGTITPTPMSRGRWWGPV
jgi:hypothetical protein